MQKGSGLNRVRHGGVLLALLVVAVIFVALRIALPPVALRLINSKLKDIPGYTGHIEAIDINLLRGSYRVRNVAIFPEGAAGSEPIFSAKSIKTHLHWGALLHGKLIGEVTVSRPMIVVSQGATKPGPKKPVPVDAIRHITAFRINNFAIKDGELHVVVSANGRSHDLYVKDINANLRNLSNMQRNSKPNYASLSLTGKAMDSGNLSLKMKVNPRTLPPDFFLEFSMLSFELTKLNGLIGKSGIDFKKGTFDLISELTVDNLQMDGYVKPLFKHVQMLSKEDLDKKKPIEIVKESLIEVGKDILENPKKSQVATKTRISGTLTDPKASIYETVFSVLRNGFVQALTPVLDGTVKPPQD